MIPRLPCQWWRRRSRTGRECFPIPHQRDVARGRQRIKLPVQIVSPFVVAAVVVEGEIASTCEGSKKERAQREREKRSESHAFSPRNEEGPRQGTNVCNPHDSSGKKREKPARSWSRHAEELPRVSNLTDESVTDQLFYKNRFRSLPARLGPDGFVGIFAQLPQDGFDALLRLRGLRAAQIFQR